MFLLDSSDAGKYGGTGLTFDWNLAKPCREIPGNYRRRA